MVCHVCCIGSYWLHGKCTQIFTGDFLCGRWRAGLPASLLFVEACSIPFSQSLRCDYERTDVTYLVEVSSVLYCCPLAWTVPRLAFFPLQCWNCCWLLWEWRDKWWHPQADVLPTPCKPHCGRCPRPGEHESKRVVWEWAASALLLNLAVRVSLPFFASFWA